MSRCRSRIRRVQKAGNRDAAAPPGGPPPAEMKKNIAPLDGRGAILALQGRKCPSDLMVVKPGAGFSLQLIIVIIIIIIAPVFLG